MSTSMQKHSVRLVGAAALLGLCSFAAVGCLGYDPNKNTMTLTGGGGGGGSGGSGGSGGGGNPNGPIVGTPLATFDTGTDGFVLNSYHDTGQINLGDPAQMISPKPMLMHDAAVGNPDLGSLTVTAPYSGANQYVDIQNTSMFGTANPTDWHGGTLHVRVRVDDGGTFGGVAEPYAISTGFIFGGTSTNFAKNNNWQEFTVDLDAPGHADTGYDDTKVVIFGLQLNSGSAGASQGPVTFHVDSFSIEGVSVATTDAGTDAGSATDAGTASDSGTGN
jgi:hypothetical protein